jgi:hypothetical protein
VVVSVNSFQGLNNQGTTRARKGAEREKKHRTILDLLTPTGLLMEGNSLDPSKGRFAHAFDAQHIRDWGYRRIQGALSNLGHEIARSTIAAILERHGIEPAPERGRKTTWKEFLTRHWELIVAADSGTGCSASSSCSSLSSRHERSRSEGFLELRMDCG